MGRSSDTYDPLFGVSNKDIEFVYSNWLIHVQRGDFSKLAAVLVPLLSKDFSRDVMIHRSRYEKAKHLGTTYHIFVTCTKLQSHDDMKQALPRSINAETIRFIHCGDSDSDREVHLRNFTVLDSAMHLPGVLDICQNESSIDNLAGDLGCFLFFINLFEKMNLLIYRLNFRHHSHWVMLLTLGFLWKVGLHKKYKPK